MNVTEIKLKNRHTVITGECLDVLRTMETDSVDLVMTSPPYENARMYGELKYSLKGDDWVVWATERYLECVRVSRGLVCWVVAGKTVRYEWSATPALLMARLHQNGVKLRVPPIYQRVGIPGSGGPDWWRNDYEFCIASSKGNRPLPWSDNTANGHAPKCPPGGRPSHQTRDGRVNRAGKEKQSGDAAKPGREYKPPKRANAGNVIRLHGGGGHMGSKLAHQNEAPFPESLVEPFVRCFCPPGGIVLDCFAGSGTVGSVAEQWGRNSILIDERDDKHAGLTLIRKRLEELSANSEQITGGKSK